MKGQTDRPPECSGDLPPGRAAGTASTAASSTAATEWNEAGHRLAGLQTILDSMTDIVLGFDSQGRLVQANAALQQLLGMDVTGVTFEQQAALFHKFGVSHPDGQPIREHDRHVFRALQGATIPDKIYRITAADGRKTAYSCSSAPITVGAKIVGSVTVGHDITERVQAADALRASEERYRLLAETMLQGVVHQDADGKIIALNPAAERILGGTREELLGSSSVHLERQTIREDGSPFPGLEHPAMVALRTGQPVHGVIMGVFNPPLGAYRWISIDAVPACRAGETRVAEVYTVFEDITERKRTEEAARSAADMFAKTFQHNATAMALSRMDSAQILDINDRWTELTGFSRAEIIGKNTTELGMWKDPTIRDAMVREVQLHGSVRDQECTCFHKNGQEWLALFSAHVITIGGEQVIVSSALDITARKRAEEALQNSEALLRSIAVNSTDVIFVKDREGRFVFMNPAGYRLNGLTPAQLIGHQKAEVHAQPEEAARSRAEDLRVLASGERVTGEETFTAPDRSQHVFLTTKGPRTDGQGQIIGLIGVAHDITERKQAEQAIRQLNESLEKRVQERTTHLLRINRALGMVSDCHQKILQATTEAELLRQICATMVEVGGYRMAWAGYAQDDAAQSVLPIAQAGAEEGYLETIRVTWADTERGCGPTGRAIRTGRPAVIRNIRSDPQFAPWRAPALARGYASCIALPLQVEGRTLGALMSYAADADAFDEAEANLLADLTKDLSYGLQTLRMRAARERAEGELARYREQLEELVQQRTRELSRLNRAVEQSPVSIVITDKRACIEYVNPHFCEVTGYTASEALGQNPRLLKSGSQPPEFYTDMWRALAAGKQWQGEFENKRKDGTCFWEHASISPLRDDTGEIMSYVAVKEDITEHKHIEAALRASQTQLRQTNEALEERVRERTATLARTNAQLELTLADLRDSEEVYRVLVDTTPDFIYSLDKTGRHTAVNRALCEALGLPDHQLIGRTHAELGFDDASVHLRSDLHRRALNGEVVHAELVTTLPRGALRTFDVSLQPIRDSMGAVIGVRGRSRDITDQRKAEAQALQSQKLEAVGILAGGVAHDFNNLLTIILGYSESLLREIHAGDPLQLDVREIQDAGLRAASLTRQLLAFSRKQALQPEVLDLNAVVRNLEKMLRRLIGEDILFQTALADDLEHVRADPGQLEQVIMNLVVNARDAMPQGGTLTLATHNVRLDAHAVKGHSELTPGPHILLAISDTGCGMDERTKAKVFEPFFTTKEKGKGTGLGLSTVYGIVKQSGGSIELDSAPHRGTTFKIFLPRVAAATSVPVKKPVATTQGQGELVLLVEDDDALRGLFQAQVKALGYRAHVAANGGEAVLAVEEKGLRPVLLLSDVVMPGMSGAVLAKRLLKTQPGLKVLFMSGYTEDAIEHHGVRDLDKPLLTKPFNFATLARKIREVLESEQNATTIA